jgi:hypothetical protein
MNDRQQSLAGMRGVLSFIGREFPADVGRWGGPECRPRECRPRAFPDHLPDTRMLEVVRLTVVQVSLRDV